MVCISEISKDSRARACVLVSCCQQTTMTLKNCQISGLKEIKIHSYPSHVRLTRMKKLRHEFHLAGRECSQNQIIGAHGATYRIFPVSFVHRTEHAFISYHVQKVYSKIIIIIISVDCTRCNFKFSHNTWHTIVEFERKKERKRHDLPTWIRKKSIFILFETWSYDQDHPHLLGDQHLQWDVPLHEMWISNMIVIDVRLLFCKSILIRGNDGNAHIWHPLWESELVKKTHLTSGNTRDKTRRGTVQTHAQSVRDFLVPDVMSKTLMRAT